MDAISNNLGNIVFCGDYSYLEACQQALADLPIRKLTPSDILDEGKQFFRSISVILLTMHEAANSLQGRNLATQDPPAALTLLTRLSEFRRKPPVILLTHNGTPLEYCCAAVQLGVSSFVDTDTPGWQDRLAAALRQIQSSRPAHVTPQKYENPLQLLDAVGIMAVSPSMQDLILKAHRAAQVSDATILIHGESGTGKQLLAEAIHRLDPKRGRFPFVPVNCAAITGTLAESELFGHIRGAFTGATETRAGYFRAAHRGTILLDEVSELPLFLQPKLLRVIQEGRVLPVGSDKEDPIDVRVIAASNNPLQQMVADGKFRLDLYQRLAVIHLTVPPLCQRTEDIPLLVMHFIKKYQHYCEDSIIDVDPRVYELLKRRVGKGNVRELENIVRQTLVFKTQGNRIELADMPHYLFQGNDPVAPVEVIPTVVADHLVGLIKEHRLTLKQAIGLFEKTVIDRAAKANPELTKVQLAQRLGLPRRTLYYKMETNG